MKHKLWYTIIALNIGFLVSPFANHLGWVSFSQNETDALRYSQLMHGGTARFTAMGGAFGALGGDFSVLSTNPAGIGIFRSSEFTCTPSFFMQKTTSHFGGNNLDDYKYNVNFNNAGIILSHYNADSKNSWKGFTFGFGYNRLANFNNRISMIGKNKSSTLLDVYTKDAQTNINDTGAMDAFGTQLALSTGAIWIDSGVVYNNLMFVYNEEQSKSVTTNGAMGETVFSFGGSYNDRLYVGATLGVPHINYREESSYSETADTNAWNKFHSFELDQDIHTTGTGINFKFGMIYKPVDWVRVGAAIHTPTYFQMHDEWSSTMLTNFYNNTSYSATSPNGKYDYSLVTPMHAIGSIGFVIKKIGLIGVDYEFVDYPSATLRSRNYKFVSENKMIHDKYQAGNNIRFGTEWRLLPLSFRAGAAYYSSPFQKGSGNNNSRMDYSVGIGFRDKNFFLDFAYVISQTKDYYYFYDAALTSPSKNKSTSTNILATLGFRF